MQSREWWNEHCHLSGEMLGKELGIDGGSARRLIRDAKRGYPTLPWYGVVLPPTLTGKTLFGIAVFDLHHPQHDKKLWANILKYVADTDPDIFVFGGDNMDMLTVSHWVGNKRLIVEGRRIKRDYADFNADILDPLDAVLREDVQRVFHLGNHEEWLNMYVEEHPEMQGMIELEDHLHLNGWKVYQYGEVSKYGHLYCTHGTYINIHNAYKTAQVYGRSMMYGHVHTLQCHTLTTPLDALPYAATSIPCGCDLNPSYRKNQPNAWTSGLAAFYVRPDGQYNLFPIVAIDGIFTAPDGTTYE